MSLPKRLFDGVGEPTEREDRVTKLEPEDLRMELERGRKIDSIAEDHASKSLKWRIANLILTTSLSVAVVLIFWAAYSKDYEPLKNWWLIAGPLVGFLLRVIFDGKSRSP